MRKSQTVDEKINPLNNIFLRNSKALCYVAIETFHNTAVHFIETIKVRAQARNIKTGDPSLYFANGVQTKRKSVDSLNQF